MDWQKGGSLVAEHLSEADGSWTAEETRRPYLGHAKLPRKDSSPAVGVDELDYNRVAYSACCATPLDLDSSPSDLENLAGRSVRGIAQSWSLGDTPRVGPTLGPSCAYRETGRWYNSAGEEVGREFYCLRMEIHVVIGSGLRLTMGSVGAGSRGDVAVGMKDVFVGIADVAGVAVAVGAAVTAGDERVDPRIPSSSMTWVLISRQRQRDSMGV